MINDFKNYCAEVAELVDALDLGSSIARCESSSLSFRTILSLRKNYHREITLKNYQLGYRQNDD